VNVALFTLAAAEAVAENQEIPQGAFFRG